MDKGLWPTIVDLFKNPKHVPESFIKGITVKYMHPFRFFFFMVTINAFLILWSNELDVVLNMTQSFQKSQSENVLKQEILNIQRDAFGYLNLFMAGSLPFLALGVKWFFSKKKYNYAETLIIATYGFGQFTLVSIILNGLIILFPSKFLTLYIINFLLSFVYFIYYFYSVFRQFLLKVIVKGILVYVMWVISYTMLMGAFMVVKIIPKAKEYIKEKKLEKEQEKNQNSEATDLFLNNI